MTLGPWRVGDTPADPIELTVTRPGDPSPLSGFTTAMFRLSRPDGTVIEWAGTISGNTVSATLPGPFAQYGKHSLWLHLTGPGVTERTRAVHFYVRDAL